MTPIYQLDQIQHHFGTVKALDIPRLELYPQQIYSLHGHNGAGKSTLLHCLALLTPPTHGSLYFNGSRIPRWGFALPRFRRQVTLVHQNPYLFAGSVEENICLGLRFHRLTSDQQQQRIAQALAAVDLTRHAHRRVNQLSGGEQKRVALARALALQPKVLLLDEPTANMDQGSVQVLEQVICNLPEQGISVVVANHDTEQAQRLNSTIIDMVAGQIISITRGDAPVTQDIRYA